MKKLSKEIPQLKKTIRIIGDLMPNDKQGDMPLAVMNELLDYKNDVEDFHDTIREMQTSMEAAKAYTDEYIQETIDDILNEYSPALEIIINSGGGSVSEGFAIIDLLKELQELYGVEINTHAIGMCASMAVAVFMAGDVRTCGENTIFMMHQISGGSIGSQNKMESAVKCMKIMSTLYKGMFKETSIPKEKLDEIMSHDVDYFFDITEAREWGIVNDQLLIEQAKEAIAKLMEESNEKEDVVEDVDVVEEEIVNPN